MSDSRSEGRGSYPGRSRLGPDGATIVANGDCQRSVIGDVGSRCRDRLYTTPVAAAVPWVFAFSMQAKQSIVVDPKSPGGVDSPHGLILFDGVCVLCSRGCGFVSKRDRRGYFRFVPMQMAEGRRVAEQLGINPDRPDSFAFVANGQASVKIRSRAAHCVRASALAVDMALSLHPTGDPRRNL